MAFAEVPSCDYLNRYNVVSFDDLVGEAEDQWRDCKTERICGLEVKRGVVETGRTSEFA
jgi:hypothetical protein